MKKIIPVQLTAACLLAMTWLLSSCFKDSCRHTYKMVTPVYTNLSVLRAAVQNTPAAAIVSPGKLYIKDKLVFLNEQGKGIHVIDNSNPSHPVQITFIHIPGNVDMAVKGNMLYADLYCDLAAINITDPTHIAVAKYLTNTFPEKAAGGSATNADSIRVITDWTTRDTTVNCSDGRGYYGPLYDAASSNSSASNPAATGTAGSTARFAPVSNYLYTVSTTNLNVIDINDAVNPLFVQTQSIGWNIETIFPYNNKLYIGSGSNMSVFDLQDPVHPQQLSWSGHWCSHDPVVADDNYAYVTLHQANACGSTVNEMDVYDLRAAGSPVLVKTYPMANPLGLSKDGNLLFVCDEGLKIYDVTNASDAKLIKHIAGIETTDVIATGGIAYVVASDGLYQYDYSNTAAIKLLSKLSK